MLELCSEFASEFLSFSVFLPSSCCSSHSFCFNEPICWTDLSPDLTQIDFLFNYCLWGNNLAVDFFFSCVFFSKQSCVFPKATIIICLEWAGKKLLSRAGLSEKAKTSSFRNVCVWFGTNTLFRFLGAFWNARPVCSDIPGICCNVALVLSADDSC